MAANTTCRRQLLALGYLAVAISGGCEAALALLDAAPTDQTPPAAVDTPPAVPDDAEPEQLRTITEDALNEATKLAETLATRAHNRAFRLARFEQLIDQGSLAADKLLAHPQVTDQQAEFAGQAKLILLSHGARQNGPRFREPLQAYVDELQQQGHEHLSALGAAVLVELTMTGSDASEETILAALESYGQSYPASSAGLKLFEQYGAQLEKQNKTEQAIDCYRKAVAAYSTLPEAAAVQSRLAALLAAEAEKLRRARAFQALQQDVNKRLGSPSGFFVIYAREIKPPSNKMFEMYAFDYEVVHGTKAAVTYVAGLKPNWQWELVQRFPDSQDGYLKARALAERLTKKRAVFKY